MKFDNRPPIDLDRAETLASAERDGGCYRDIGFDIYRIYKGKKYHLVHLYNSGCDYGGGTHTSREHVGLFETVEALAEYLRARPATDAGFPWWASELLDAMEIPAEQA